ncbi:MAG TPA: alpha-ketoacid dehydrogenase subunit beta [Anaerolineales bacterium]|nr:alpha-ketoacid dehydrogenase subunit beta [Anaerolineales bacterium]
MAEMTFTDAARAALAEEMERDPMIFVVGEGIGPRGGNFNTTVGLHELYGDMRLRDTPISERGFTGLCTGAAVLGARPVVDFMFLDFELDALGEIINQTSRLRWMSNGQVKVPIVIRGGVGVASTGPHHSSNLFSVFMHIPGLHVVTPVFPADAKGLLKTAIRSDDPVIFLEHKKLMKLKGPVPDGEHLVPFGKAAIVRPGTDVTIVAISYPVVEALSASRLLEADGISAEVIDPRTLAPLDIDTILKSVAKTHRLLVVDEDFAPCGAAAEIATQVMERAFYELDAPVRRLNGAFIPAPYSPPLEAAVVPNAASIAQAVRALIQE